MPQPSIKEHMEVIGADGVHIGTVDRIENGRIKLTKADSGEGRHRGHHFTLYRLRALVAEKSKGRKVRLFCERKLRSLSRWKKSSPLSQCDGTGSRLRHLCPSRDQNRQ